MPQNKYKLRSEEVQEVMNKPPHSLITWGNTLVFTILVVGVYLLSLIQSPDKVSVPFQLNVSDNGLSCLLGVELPSEIKPNQIVLLAFESYPSENYGKVTQAFCYLRPWRKKLSFLTLVHNTPNSLLVGCES